MRVFPNNDGSELVFTLYRRPDVSDKEFAEDAKSVERGLANLKTLLEKQISEHQQKSLPVGHPIS